MLMNDRIFKKLYGISKQKRRYICHQCFYEADPRGRAHLEPGECQVAYLDGAIDQIMCLMCGSHFSIDKRVCGECSGNIISTESDHFGKCHSCGRKNN